MCSTGSVTEGCWFARLHWYHDFLVLKKIKMQANFFFFSFFFVFPLFSSEEELDC